MSEPKHRISFKYIGVAVTIIAMFASVCIWVGATNQKVEENGEKVEKLEANRLIVDVNQGIILNELKNINKKLDEIQAELKEQ